MILSPSFWLLLHGACIYGDMIDTRLLKSCFNTEDNKSCSFAAVSCKCNFKCTTTMFIYFYKGGSVNFKLSNQSWVPIGIEQTILIKNKRRPCLHGLIPWLCPALQPVLWTLCCCCCSCRLQPLGAPKTAALAGHWLPPCCRPSHQMLIATEHPDKP